ncbi:hypothetical protein CHISP_1489 [Chitinispirillum alkaliphilum]|nr:hypothetical protein CHISP_1489 [Chitinispirillum alkaliphilum]
MHMGNITLAFGIESGAPVHPHAYGEHITEFNRDRLETGSSPCIWGT